MGTITRYFCVEPNQAQGYKSVLVPDNDILPLSNLESMIVGTLADGRKIIHAVIPDWLVQEMQEQTGLENPLTIEGLQALDIMGKWAGMNRESVFEYFPELAGQYQAGVDEEGNPIFVDKLMVHRWCGEE